jgi:hypothetical protein
MSSFELSTAARELLDMMCALPHAKQRKLSEHFPTINVLEICEVGRSNRAKALDMLINEVIRAGLLEELRARLN